MPYEGAWRTGVAQGRENERERIIKLLQEGSEFESAGYLFSQIISDNEFKLPDGNDVVEVTIAWRAFDSQLNKLISIIKGEN
jgi:hypothetical protein